MKKEINKPAISKEFLLQLLSSDFSEEEQLQIKKDEVSTDLISLMHLAGKNRSNISQILELPKSRVTRILSGQENLTLKTIFQFCRKLGYDFDIKYRLQSSEKCSQPWSDSGSYEGLKTFIKENFIPQTADQVRRDFQNGNEGQHYLKSISIDEDRDNKFIPKTNTSRINYQPSKSRRFYFTDSSEIHYEYKDHQKTPI